jgi:hypothetical protein
MATYSWKRGLLHGLIWVVLVIAAGGIIAASAGNADPEKIGEGTGRFALFALVLGVGISYLFQTGKRTLGWVAAAILFAGIAGLTVFAITYEREPAPPLTASDRAPLELVEVGGERRLRHPAFGFSILHPGPTFTMSPEMAGQMKKALNDPSTQFHAWADMGAGSILVVGLVNGRGTSREDLERTIDGFEKGMTEAAGGKPAAGVVVKRESREVSWERRQARLHTTVTMDAVKAHVRVTAHGIEPAGKPPAIVVLISFATQTDALTGVLDSFQP